MFKVHFSRWDETNIPDISARSALGPSVESERNRAQRGYLGFGAASCSVPLSDLFPPIWGPSGLGSETQVMGKGVRRGKEADYSSHHPVGL